MASSDTAHTHTEAVVTDELTSSLLTAASGTQLSSEVIFLLRLVMTFNYTVSLTIQSYRHIGTPCKTAPVYPIVHLGNYSQLSYQFISSWKIIYALLTYSIQLNQMWCDVFRNHWVDTSEIFGRTCGTKWTPRYTVLTDGW